MRYMALGASETKYPQCFCDIVILSSDGLEYLETQICL
ncbi:hypothetical protein Nmel_009835 [Mimus melanotis]